MTEKPVPVGFKFLFGGLSGCGAAAVVQPMDLVKNRMQVNFVDLGLLLNINLISRSLARVEV